MTRSFEVGTRGFESGGRGFLSTLGPVTSNYEVEYWEDASPLSEWGGETSEYSTSTTTAPVNGSTTSVTTSGTTDDSISSSSGLPAYPSRGNTFRWWWRANTGSTDSHKQNVTLHFARQDSSNYIAIRGRPGNDDQFDVFSIVGGNVNDGINSATSLGASANEWHYYEVVWGDGSGNIDVTLYDSNDTALGNTSIPDNDFSSGGLLVGQNGEQAADQAWFDDIYNVVNYVEDFERTSPLNDYTGDTGNYSVNATAAKTGSNGVQCTTDNSAIISTSGLNDYPEPGDTFRWWFRGENADSTPGVVYGVQDSNNYYLATNRPFGTSQSQTVYIKNSGAWSAVLSTSATLSQSTWYQGEVEWGSSGGHTFRVLDDTGTEQFSASGTDSTHGSGGAGFDSRYCGTSPDIRIDGYRII